jgi:hypothetical protein
VKIIGISGIKGGIYERQYNELARNSKKKNMTDIYRGIN